MEEGYLDTEFANQLVLGVLCVSKVREGFLQASGCQILTPLSGWEAPLFKLGPSGSVMAFVPLNLWCPFSPQVEVSIFIVMMV